MKKPRLESFAEDTFRQEVRAAASAAGRVLASFPLEVSLLAVRQLSLDLDLQATVIASMKLRDAELQRSRESPSNNEHGRPSSDEVHISDGNRLVRLPEVKKRTGLSVTSIYQKMGVGKFPKSRRLGDNSIGWLERDIVQWMAELPHADETKSSARSR